MWIFTKYQENFKTFNETFFLKFYNLTTFEHDSHHKHSSWFLLQTLHRDSQHKHYIIIPITNITSWIPLQTLHIIPITNITLLFL